MKHVASKVFHQLCELRGTPMGILEQDLALG